MTSFRDLVRQMNIDDATLVHHLDALLRDFVTKVAPTPGEEGVWGEQGRGPHSKPIKRHHHTLLRPSLCVMRVTVFAAAAAGTKREGIGRSTA
jgi:hypothetical protein